MSEPATSSVSPDPTNPTTADLIGETAIRAIRDVVLLWNENKALDAENKRLWARIAELERDR